MKQTVVLLLCAVLGLGRAWAGEEKKEFSSKADLHYWVILPDGFVETEKYPLVLFLHGAGERGEDLEMVKKHGPFRKLAERAEPVILVAPQCPKEAWWSAEALEKLLDQVERDYRVDKKRVYLTGLSMGGFGTWALAAAEPKRFAAILPICGGGNPAEASKLKKIPMWVFHGDQDKTVPLQKSQEMVDAVIKAGGEPKFTIYPGVGHDSWTRAYADPAVYDWLFAQHQ
jgi:predicted peptidase